MRDLVVITADADMEAVMKAVLQRPLALGIRPVDHEVRRHDGRDSGLFQHGPDATRSLKGDFQRLLMLWDFHGSGQERKATAESSAAALCSRLDAISWKGISSGVSIDPELEEWLWHNPAAIEKWLPAGDRGKLGVWVEDFSGSRGETVESAKRRSPKELLEFVCVRSLKRRPRPQDYARIAEVASLADWQCSPTFKAVTGQLRAWFPPQSLV